MGQIVVFGARDFASLAHFYLRHDSPHEVVAFTVNREFLPPQSTFEGLPIVPFETLERDFPPDRCMGFAPMSHKKMNQLRRSIYDQFRAKGYGLISYISSRATIFPGTSIGDNCFILEDNTIQPFVTIGNNVVLWSGNHVGHHSTVGNHVFCTSHVVISGHCKVGDFSFLGVNAAIKDQTTIGEGTLVGMGALITKDTEPWSVHRGQPAKGAAISSRDVDF